MRIQLDLSFRVVFSRIVRFGAYPVGFGAYPAGLGAYPVGFEFEGKISIGALDIFNGGVKNPTGVLKGSMGA